MSDNNKINLYIVIGVLSLAIGIILGLFFKGPTLPEKILDQLVLLVTSIISGLIGFLSRGYRKENDVKETQETNV